MTMSRSVGAVVGFVFRSEIEWEKKREIRDNREEWRERKKKIENEWVTVLNIVRDQIVLKDQVG